jgi:hypothetical protein
VISIITAAKKIHPTIGCFIVTSLAAGTVADPGGDGGGVRLPLRGGWARRAVRVASPG